ncbi:TetR/AcrR family transcriptional regulator [Spirosoma arcticum]
MARPLKFDTEPLLDKAMHLFWRQGYEATSVQELGRELDLHPGSIYNTFGDKHSLFLAALDRYALTGGQYLTSLLQKPGSPRQAIEDTLFLVARVLATGEGRQGCLMTNSAVELGETDSDVARKVTDFQTRFETDIASVLQRAQNMGEMRPRSVADTLAVARFLNGCMRGMQVLAKADPNPHRLNDIARIAVQALD